MFTTVELPVWALVLMGVLAAVTAASHLLFPSVRWFFRRRAERVVARLNTKLARPIQPFKLARRHDMIQNVLYDPDVIRAVNAYADEKGIPDNVAFETAQRYAREIVPSFSASVYFGLGTKLARWLSRSLYRVRVVNARGNAMAAIDPEATVVFIINHRSNMDYVLVTYLAARDSALSYAVGEWARVWPLRPLIKMMGGYFIRRKSLSPLYRRILARYVQLSTREGVTQAVFPEGGLSRTGALGKPKLGLISYIVDGFDPNATRDVVFVPVGLNYDRVLEDRVLVAAAEDKSARFRFRIVPVFRYVGRHLWQRLTGKFHRLGFAAVAFGEPLSLKQFLAEGAAQSTEALGEELMARVGRVVPILPVPLVCQLLETAGGKLARAELETQFAQEVARFRASGLELCMPTEAGGVSVERAVKEALRMLEVRALIRVDAGQITVTDKAPEAITYYASSLQHFDAT
ncbi:1-acyl-sn-glycerol-3-phosphate acyltransferase [Litoreibacter arenae]|uniref:Glycerol-3-phosphate acyltransferase n=1 Tax=Litoreibacter arenae DSM 19593 TaxID=1123360 RepID=S9QPK3_9RHOB|nr:1-acyl-sn-glycerol-3-phosphate acyltransferase [Litoreibacter arenae]EPX81567.1 Acyltransferase family protein associated with ethylmalonyl-CoA pathway [Litoreibacter arenae DSM 19593]